VVLDRKSHPLLVKLACLSVSWAPTIHVKSVTLDKKGMDVEDMPGCALCSMIHTLMF
jgi:hypothetical protein